MRAILRERWTDEKAGRESARKQREKADGEKADGGGRLLGWLRNFQYDAHGNMWLTKNLRVPLAGNTPTSNVYQSGNQIKGATYDLAGNQLTVNGNTAAYDAENRQTRVYNPQNQATETYAYDGAGQRVQKAISGTTVVYVYDAFGQLAAQYSPAATLAKDYIRFGGQVVATENAGSAPCKTCYFSYDHLGSVRMITDQNAKVIARHDYLPFGEEVVPPSAERTPPWGERCRGSAVYGASAGFGNGAGLFQRAVFYGSAGEVYESGSGERRRGYEQSAELERVQLCCQ